MARPESGAGQVIVSGTIYRLVGEDLSITTSSGSTLLIRLGDIYDDASRIIASDPGWARTAIKESSGELIEGLFAEPVTNNLSKMPAKSRVSIAEIMDAISKFDGVKRSSWTAYEAIRRHNAAPGALKLTSIHGTYPADTIDVLLSERRPKAKAEKIVPSAEKPALAIPAKAVVKNWMNQREVRYELGKLLNLDSNNVTPNIFKLLNTRLGNAIRRRAGDTNTFHRDDLAAMIREYLVIKKESSQRRSAISKRLYQEGRNVGLMPRKPGGNLPEEKNG